MIETVIGRQAFEVIRDRIAQILLTELNHQAIIAYDPELNVDEVFVERFMPVNHSECPVVNVSLERGDYSRKDIKSVDGGYRYFIEITTKAKTTEDERGDSRAKIKLHKMLGICRSILENPQYTTLGFNKPFIGNRHVESIMFSKPEEHSTEGSVEGFLVLAVRVNETTPLGTGLDWVGSITSVKLSQSDEGYYWEINA